MNTNFGLFLNGYKELSIENNKVNRLIGFCNRNKIKIYDVKFGDEKTSLKISIYNFKKLKSFLEKSQITPQIINQKGLPYILAKTGSIITIISIIILTFLYIKIRQYIWNIEITGNKYYSSEQIKEVLKEYDVDIGCRKKSINCKNLENVLRERFTNVEWISCSLNKTNLKIDLFDVGNTETVCPKNSLISENNMIIKKIIPYQGTVVKEAGDEVFPGDVLIDNNVIIYNDYGEEIDRINVEAKGYVEGEAIVDYFDSVNKDGNTKVYYDEFKTFDISFNNYGYTLFDIKKQNVDIQKKTLKLRVKKNVFLPFSISRNKNKLYKLELMKDNVSTVEIVKNNLNQYIQDLKKKGVQIVENNVKIYEENGKIIAVGTLKLKIIIDSKGE